MTRCGCMRYPITPCLVETDALVCPDCTGARCVVVVWEGETEKEHVSADRLIPLGGPDEL